MEGLGSTYYFDFENTAIQHLVLRAKEKSTSQIETIGHLYTMIRDHWWYDAFDISFEPQHYKASYIALKNKGNCVEKSILLIACLRAIEVPAKLHLGKVKNHIAAENLIRKIGTNELSPHGIVTAFIKGKWIKLSPVFNKELCEKFKVAPLGFNPNQSTYLQQFNAKGSLFMEYIEDYGTFDDVPLDFMKQNIEEHYPGVFT